MKKRIKIEDTSEDFAEEVIEGVKSRRDRVREIASEKDLIPSGSTLLNCALSDNPLGGYGIGKLVNLIGDSHSGKSLLALYCLAEVAVQERFKDYNLYYDDVEVALEFDLDYLFGGEFAKRIIVDDISASAEEFYGNVYRKIQEGKPFIYVLDTFDALYSEDDRDRAEEFAAGKKVGGRYTDGKPKLVSEMLRTIKGDIKTKEALVIIISQTRDNIGFGSQFQPKVRTGGRALKFYSTHEFWLAVKKSDRENKYKRQIGAITEAKITKNKITGKKRDADIYIYTDYGIDDIAANVDFLVDNGAWKKDKNTIMVPEFKLQGVRRKIIYDIEEMNLQDEVVKLVGQKWNEIEESIRLDRKPRYE